ncbi:MAG: energy-coupling factor transporter transmembrane component T [Clostridia bacterium]
MIKDITLGQYLPGQSIIHKADPRIKIMFTFLFMVVLFIVSSFYSLLLAFLFILIVFRLSGISYRFMLKGIRPILYIILFTVVLNIFLTPGTPVLEIWFLTITREGLLTAGLVSSRVFMFIISGSIMTYTTTPIMLTDAIESLLKPLKKIKVPVHEMAMMMAIALRFIPTLIDETDKIIKAQAARGADIGTGNMIERAKSFIPILIPLFISAFRRADDLAIAMEARCYRGSEGRTSLRVLKYTRTDLFITIVFLLVCASMLFLQFI